MVSLRLDAEAAIRGTDDQEKHPIVAKVKGTGKDGGLSVQVSGEDSKPIGAKVSGDSESPIALAPITLIPDVKAAVEALNLGNLMDSLAKISQGLKVEVSSSKGEPISLAPVTVALGKIPVDITISVISPAEEPVFRIEIKGSVGSP